MQKPFSRRELFGKVASWTFGATAGLLGLVPALRSVLGLSGVETVRAPDDFLPLGQLGELPSEPSEVPLRGEMRDGWQRQEVGLGSVWVRREGSQVKVFSSICPHVGCSIDYQPTDRHFHCPCHNSSFDLEGRVISGPAPRSLDELPIQIAPDGQVSCRYLRFAPGTATRRII